MASYFTCRKVSKAPNMGCPQGSVLGPLVWNFIVDRLLLRDMPADCNLRAYADDVAIDIHGRSRADLEAKAQGVMDILHDWLTENGLTLSVGKCQYMVFHGSLDRPLTVKYRGANLQCVHEVRYLGVLWDDKLSFVKHIQEVCQAAKALYFGLRQVIRHNWGSPPDCMLKIYRGAILPKVLYAIGIWGDRLTASATRTSGGS